MLTQAEMDALEKRAAAARMTMAEVCEAAGVAYTTWWRWQKSGRATIKKFRKLEAAVADKEAAAQLA